MPKELPAEVLNTGDIEILELSGSGGRQPCNNESVVVVDPVAADQLQRTEPEQPVINTVAGDVEAEDATAGAEVLSQSPASDNRHDSERDNLEIECETDSDPCLDDDSESDDSYTPGQC